MAQRQAYVCDACGRDVETEDPSGMVFYLVAGQREPREVDSATVNPLIEAMNLLRVPRVDLCQTCTIAMMSAAPQLVDLIAQIALSEAERANLPADERASSFARAELVRDRARAFRDSVRDRLNAAAAERAEGSP